MYVYITYMNVYPVRLSSSVLELSVHQHSPLATPTILPPTGSVETAQPIRTMSIIVEGGVRVQQEGGWERPSKEGKTEEVEEAEEQLEVTDSYLQLLFHWSICAHVSEWKYHGRKRKTLFLFIFRNPDFFRARRPPDIMIGENTGHLHLQTGGLTCDCVSR